MDVSIMTSTVKFLTLQKWPCSVRLCHILMAIGITIQLWSSLVMSAPSPLKSPEQLALVFFWIHVYAGIIASVTALGNMIAVIFNNTLRGHLFPWHKKYLPEFFTDIKTLLKFKLLPVGPKHGGLGGFIHGLGLLCAVAMSITGLILAYVYLGKPLPINSPYWAKTGFLHDIKELHKFIATFMWIYWCGHVLMALSHLVFSKKNTT